MGIIYRKILQKSGGVTRKVRMPINLFQGEGLRAKYALQLRPISGGLSLAEGSEKLFSTAQAGKIFVGGVSGALYCYFQGVFSRFEGTYLYQIGPIPQLNGVVECPDGDGVLRTYLLSDDGVFVADTAIEKLTSAPNSRCGTYHYDRLFTAFGRVISFSHPLQTNVWTKSMQGSGSITLPAEGGEVVALLSYKDKVYIFREHAIEQLKAGGDTLNFRITEIPYSCGKMLAHSVACCGNYVYFCTEDGFYQFNGGVCKRIGGIFPFVRDESVQACSFDGRYYLTVTYDCEQAIFVYSTEEGGYFLSARATCVAGGDALYYLGEKGGLYRLTASGFIADDERDAYFEGEFSTFNLTVGNKRVKSLSVEGEGVFLVEIHSDSGDRVQVKGKAGGMIKLPRAVQGNAFSVNLTVRSPIARILGVAFEIVEEGGYGN